MEKRALAAEERATEDVVMERKARAALEAREKQMANMRVRVSLQKFGKIKKKSANGMNLSFGSQLDKMTSNAEKSESQRKILEEYVGKLERRLGSSEGKNEKCLRESRY